MEHVWTTSNFSTIFHSSAYRTIALRTIGIAAAVTVADALLAFPFAYYMARVASRRRRSLLFVAVLLPLWSSYLLRVYAWRLILNHDGLLNWTLGKLGLPDANIAYTNVAVWIVFTYIWLPFMIIPIYGALERIPNSTIEASLDLGAKGGRTFRSVILPLALPGVVAGSIFTFALTLGDYVTPTLVGGTNSEFIGNVVYESVGVSNNIPFAAAYATIPLAVMGIYLVIAKRLGAFEALLMETRVARMPLGAFTALVLAFLWIPIVIICLYAFNSSNVQSWPIAGLSFKWFSPAIHDPDMQAALKLSLEAALAATTIALVLGLTAGLALNRLHFFGKEAVSFLFVLPLALPGIITGMALNSFFVFWHVNFGLWTIVIGHATFCVVVVYNNVLARMRRVPGSLTEASMDLGAGPLTDVVVRDDADDLDRAHLRRAARVRALVRRGDRDHVHRGRPEHAAALDLREHPARRGAPRDERRRPARARRDGPARRSRAAADPRERDPSHRGVAAVETAAAR